MLKPRKRKNGAVILSPRISVAIVKKLVVQDGKWVSEGFSQYTSLTMCAEMRKMHSKKGRDRRSQMPKVIRTVAGWYMRYMKKNFPHAAQPFEEGSFVRTEPSAICGEFPVRTGTALQPRLHLSLTNRPESKPASPEIERLLRSKRSVVKSAPNENGVCLETTYTKWEDGGYGVSSRWIDGQGRPTNRKGELLNLPEIKGVHLKQSKPGTDLVSAVKNNFDQGTLDAILKEFGTQIELDLINRVRSGKMDEETDRNIDSVTDAIMKRWADNLFKERDSVELSLPDSDLKLTLRRPTQEDIQNIDLSSAYPKPGEQ
ncbi:TPA: hypothetical protein ACTPQ1_004505 [Salmonella enterica]